MNECKFPKPKWVILGSKLAVHSFLFYFYLNLGEALLRELNGKSYH